jgi:hypothetical protein
VQLFLMRHSRMRDDFCPWTLNYEDFAEVALSPLMPQLTVGQQGDLEMDCCLTDRQILFYFNVKRYACLFFALLSREREFWIFKVAASNKSLWDILTVSFTFPAGEEAFARLICLSITNEEFKQMKKWKTANQFAVNC